MKKIVYICSPLRADKDHTMEEHIEHARKYSKWASSVGVVGIAPHLLFTQFLNDNDPEQRELGMNMGIDLLCRCDEVWVFGPDHSQGMKAEMAVAMKAGIPIVCILPDDSMNPRFDRSGSICKENDKCRSRNKKTSVR